MAVVVYGLCALTSVVCAWLLLRACRRQPSRLLLWSGLAFFGLALDNLLLVLDKFVFLETDLTVLWTAVALGSLALLLYGLIWGME
jgi:hypothetical protein